MDKIQFVQRGVVCCESTRFRFIIQFHFILCCIVTIALQSFAGKEVYGIVPEIQTSLDLKNTETTAQRNRTPGVIMPSTKTTTPEQQRQKSCPVYNLSDAPMNQDNKPLKPDCSWVDEIDANGTLCFIASYDKYYLNWVPYFTSFALEAYPNALVFLNQILYEHDPETNLTRYVKVQVFEAMTSMGVNMSRVIDKDLYIPSIKGLKNIANIYRLLEIPDPRCEFVYITDTDLALESITGDLVEYGINFMKRTCVPYANQLRELFGINKICDDQLKGSGDRLTGINHFIYVPRYVKLFSCAMKEAKRIVERGDLVDWCCAKKGFCDEHLLHNILSTSKDRMIPRFFCTTMQFKAGFTKDCYPFKDEESCKAQKGCVWKGAFQVLHGVHTMWGRHDVTLSIYNKEGASDRIFKHMTIWLLNNMVEKKYSRSSLQKAEEVFGFYCKRFMERYDLLTVFDTEEYPFIIRGVRWRLKPFLDVLCPIEKWKERSNSFIDWKTFEYRGSGYSHLIEIWE